mgnify:CR=1 FL=1
MDFNSLASGSPFYILKKSEHPTLLVGTVKERTASQPKYQAQAVPTAFNGTNIQQVMSITATVNGKDETFTDVPCNIEIAQRGSDTFTGSREAMLQAVDAMIQASKKSLDMMEYHRTVLAEGDKMLEVLNPRYAEEKRQTQTIKTLEAKQAETDKKLSNLETQNAEMLQILRRMNVATPKN